MYAKEYCMNMKKEMRSYAFFMDGLKRIRKQKQEGFTCLRSKSYDGAVIQRGRYYEGGIYGKLEDMIDDEQKLQELALARIAEHYTKLHEFTLTLEKIPDDYRYCEILYNQYVDGLSLEQIADNMYLSYDWVHKLSVDARKMLQAVLDGTAGPSPLDVAEVMLAGEEEPTEEELQAACAL